MTKTRLAAAFAATALISLAIASSASAAVSGGLTYTVADNKVEITGCDGGYDACPASLVIPATIEGKPVTKTGFRAFSYSTVITHVSLPEGLTEIGTLSLSPMPNLESVTLPSTLVRIKTGALAQNPKLTAIAFPAGLQAIDWGAFAESGLVSVTLPEGMTHVVGASFNGLPDLESVTLPSTIESIDNGALGNDPKLTTVTIPASVSFFGSEAFDGDSGLTSIHFQGNSPEVDDTLYGLPTNVTAEIDGDLLSGYGAEGDDFYGLTVRYPKYSYATSGGNVAITGCADGTCPTALTIPPLVDGHPVTSIGASAFSAASSLVSITIPASVTSIGASAFQNAISLATVKFVGNAPAVGALAFNGVAPGATATLARPTLTGFGFNGRAFHGLVVTGALDGDITDPVAPGLSGVPTQPTKLTTATITLTGENGATFNCSVDGHASGPCTSPLRLSGLAVGDHTLRVTQTDAAGNTGPAVDAQWTVLPTPTFIPTLLAKVGLNVNLSTKVTTLTLKAGSDRSKGANPVKWVEYWNHPVRPAANAAQKPKFIVSYATTVKLKAGQVAFWVRVKDSKGSWSGWYRTRFNAGW